MIWAQAQFCALRFSRYAAEGTRTKRMSNQSLPNGQWRYRLAGIQPLIKFRSALAFAILFSALLVPALAQDSPRVQLFGGYSFLSFNSQPFGFTDRTSLHGFTLAPSYNLTHAFGVSAQLSSQYGSQISVRNLTAGPQVMFTRGNMLFFGHLLIGKGRTFVQVGEGAGNSAKVLELGGGIDLGLSSHFSVRTVQADFVHNSFFNGSQNSVRISTGLVYHLGGIKKGRKPSLTD